MTAPAVLAVTLLVIDKAPAPVTLKPAPTEIPPTADAVATGRSAAARATVPVIKPCALYVIPDRVEAPPLTALFIPRFPEATFNERSRLELFNLAGVILASLIFVAPSKPVVAEVDVSTLSFVIAPF